MVYVNLTPIDFKIQSQYNNCNVSIIFGSSNTPATVNVYGNLTNYITSINVANNIIVNGNIGIGTTQPNHRLHIYSSNKSNYENNSILLENSTEGEVGVAFRNNLMSTNTWVMGLDSNLGRLYLGYGAQSNQIDAPSTDITFMMNGNVGIGTTDPKEKLHIYGGDFVFPQGQIDGHIFKTTPPYAGLDFYDYSTNTIKYYVNTTNISTSIPLADRGTTWSTNDNTGMRFITGTRTIPATEKMCILGNGNIGIGTAIPLTGVHINRTTYISDSVGINTASVPQKLNVVGNSYFNGNIGIGITNPLYSLHLSRDSAAKPSTNTWTTASDARLKTNIENADLDMCWNNIKEIPLKHYTWREDIYNSNEIMHRSRMGWIAQDIEPIFPKSVEKKELYDIPDCRVLNTDQLYASMYGALQKAIGKVEEYEKTVEELTKLLEEKGISL